MSQPGKVDLWMLLLYGLLLLAGLTAFIFGIFEYGRRGDPTMLGLGVLAVILPAGLYPLAVAAGGMAARDRQEILNLLRTVNDRLLVSDMAKRVAYRREDRDALRAAIREDIDSSDYESADALASEMAAVYGHQSEAQQLRDHIRASRKAEIERQIDESVARLDTILAAHDWDTAASEAIRVMKRFPESPRVRHLDQRVRVAREQHKHELERQFLEAAKRDDVELAMELLKELDLYLTEAEAEPYRETARGVITRKRENLGLQFKLAVHDGDWAGASRIGEQIMEEFPNSKMAGEVRALIKVLRERAAAQRAGHAPGAPSVSTTAGVQAGAMQTQPAVHGPSQGATPAPAGTATIAGGGGVATVTAAGAAPASVATGPAATPTEPPQPPAAAPQAPSPSETPQPAGEATPTSTEPQPAADASTASQGGPEAPKADPAAETQTRLDTTSVSPDSPEPSDQSGADESPR